MVTKGFRARIYRTFLFQSCPIETPQGNSVTSNFDHNSVRGKLPLSIFGLFTFGPDPSFKMSTVHIVSMGQKIKQRGLFPVVHQRKYYYRGSSCPPACWQTCSKVLHYGRLLLDILSFSARYLERIWNGLLTDINGNFDEPPPVIVC